MGSGKSSLGLRLAAELGWKFVDMDELIEAECGMKVSEIFVLRGEEFFRAKEREVLHALAQQRETVVATGGGVPVHGDNMETINAAGFSVYLQMSPAQLMQRLKGERDKRPLIKGMDDGQLLEYIQKTLPERELYYRKAHLTIDCDGVGYEYLINHIKNYLEHKR